MSAGRNRWSLEDVSKKSPEIQRQIAEQLYGKSPSTEREALKVQAETVAAAIPSEHASQTALIQWWHFEALKRGLPEQILMAFPLAGVRTAAAGGRLKAEGMRAGTPDLLLAIPRGDRAGLWIEMKTESKRSKLGENQKVMLKILAKDHATVVCRTTREAQAVITAYLEMV